MNRRFFRLAAAAALVSLLALASPVQAMDLGRWAPGASLTHVWSWLERLWAPAPAPTVKSDRSNDMDPDGATSTSSPLPVENPRGGGIDPNG